MGLVAVADGLVLQMAAKVDMEVLPFTLTHRQPFTCISALQGERNPEDCLEHMLVQITIAVGMVLNSQESLPPIA